MSNLRKFLLETGFDLQLFGEGDGDDESGDDESGDDEGGDKGGADSKSGDRDPVPYKRFKKVNDAKKNLETENAKLKTDLADAQTRAKGKEEADSTLKREKDEEVTAHTGTKDQLRVARLENSFIKEAQKAGVVFADLDDAIRLADFSEVDFDDKGQPDRDDVAAVVKSLAKNKPHLVKAEGGDRSPNFPGGKPPKGSKGGEKTAEDLAAERAKSRGARREGTVQAESGGSNPWATK